MEDISKQLAGILNDPESMERVKRMAENLLGGEIKKEEPKEVSLLSILLKLLFI